MDCRPPGSSVHGISQVRILVWGAISFSRANSQREREQASDSGAGRGGKGKWLLSGMELLLRDDEDFLNQLVMTVVQPWECTRSQWVAHFKRFAHFMNCMSIKNSGSRYKIKTKDWLSLYFPSETESQFPYWLSGFRGPFWALSVGPLLWCPLEVRAHKSGDDGLSWERQGPCWGHWRQCTKINRSRNVLIPGARWPGFKSCLCHLELCDARQII